MTEKGRESNSDGEKGRERERERERERKRERAACSLVESRFQVVARTVLPDKKLESF